MRVMDILSPQKGIYQFYGYYASVSEIYEGWRSYMPYIYGRLTLGYTGSLPIVEKNRFFTSAV